jgi:hypothetical protein
MHTERAERQNRGCVDMPAGADHVSDDLVLVTDRHE